MPNVLHVDCPCGHAGEVEVSLSDELQGILKRMRCRVCRRKGCVENFRLGWMDDSAWANRTRTEIERRAKDQT